MLGNEYKENDIENNTDKYLLPFQIASKYYPELNGVKIGIAFKSIKTSMAARPKGSFLFKPKDQRKYYIFINNGHKKVKGVRFEELSLNAQVGLVGHELAHIVDYESKSKWKIVKTGIGYLFKNPKKRLESEVDYIAIEKGLGWQIYDFYDYIQNSSECSSKYKKYKQDIYFSSGEIFFFIYNLQGIY